MLLVVERRQSRRLPGAVRSERQRAIKQRKRRLRSLLLSTAGARFPTLAADRFNPTSVWLLGPHVQVRSRGDAHVATRVERQKCV
jgi:hypothetical protein